MRRKRDSSPPFESDVVRELSASERKRLRKQRRRRLRPRRPRNLLGPVLLVVLLVTAGVVAAGFAGQGPYASLAARNEPTSSIAAATATSLPGGTTTLEFLLDGRDYRPGDCVIWDQDAPPGAYHPTQVVPCDRDHLIEIAGRVETAGPKDHVPTDDEWKAIIDRDCRTLAEQHLGGPVDPFGRYHVSAVHPSDDGWRQGQRDLWCGLQASWPQPGTDPLTPSGHDHLTSFRGAVREHPQHWTYEPGGCLTVTGSWTTPCAQPHHMEITGTVTLPDDTVLPPEEDNTAWSRLVDDGCRNRSRTYLGHEALDPWDSGWVPIRPESWATGARSVACFVGQWDGSTWATVTGSARTRSA